MKRGNLLLQFFLGVLAAQGLAAEALDPWRGWVAFKEFARRAAEEPDSGVSVQFTRSLRPAALTPGTSPAHAAADSSGRSPRCPAHPGDS